MTLPFDKPLWNKQVPQVILTGIRVSYGSLWTPADLWIVGDTFILNCPTSNDGDTFWHHLQNPDDLAGIPSIEIGPADFFERRGVIVVHRQQATLSPEAIAYMQGVPK